MVKTSPGAGAFLPWSNHLGCSGKPQSREKCGRSNLAVSGRPIRDPVDRGPHSSTNKSSCCSKFAAPAIGLSGAVCELVRTLTFGTLATSIGTVEPTATTLRNWIRQYLTAHYTAPLAAALTFGSVLFPFRLIELTPPSSARANVSSPDSGFSYH
jgi:hypothetical protein